MKSVFFLYNIILLEISKLVTDYGVSVGKLLYTPGVP